MPPLTVRACARTLASALAGLALLTAAAQAQLQSPASQLVYHEFDNRPGMVTVLTATNVHPTSQVRVKYMYRESANCLEFNRTDALGPLDTFTFLTALHAPIAGRGYVVARAVNTGGSAIVFNHLVGTALRIDGVNGDHSGWNPAVFQGIGDGTLIDINGDGNLALDGLEYTTPPEVLLFPRMMGSGFDITTELVLIDLSSTAGQKLATFEVFNDNEELFGVQHLFSCWERTHLDAISGVFTNAFLQGSTNHDPYETIGVANLEIGWFSVRGSTPEGAPRPVLALLIEGVDTQVHASRPFAGTTQLQAFDFPAVCLPDFTSTLEDNPVAIDVLANDQDPEGSLDCGSIEILTPPTNGLALVGSGCVGVGCATCTLVYHPNPGFFGQDSFEYRVADGQGAYSRGCQVLVDVEPLIAFPICPTGVTLELSPVDNDYEVLDLHVVAGVIDPGGLPLTIVIDAITQDEPVSTFPLPFLNCDGDGVGTSTALIRRESVLSGDGRVYNIHYTATNSAGRSCSGVLIATVRSFGSNPPVDSGQNYDSTQGC